MLAAKGGRWPPPGQHRAGSLAAYNKNLGYWMVCSPHEPMFSVVSMIATFYYDDGWHRVEGKASSRDDQALSTGDKS